MYILVFHGILIEWSSKISSHQLSQNIKQNYVTYMAQSYFHADLPSTSNLNKFDDVFTRSSKPATPTKSAETNPIEVKESISNDDPVLPLDINQQIAETNQIGIATIGSAVEGVPGYTGRDYQISRREKRLNYRKSVKVFRSHQDNVQIPNPEVAQFASQNGTRDFYETIATMEANEIDIKYCFEQFARYDPSLSGDVSISFTIHPEGFVIPASVKITQNTIHDYRIAECIRKQIQRWRNFTPLAYHEGNFTVTRKYVF
jgi:hypothetical protein